MMRNILTITMNFIVTWFFKSPFHIDSVLRYCIRELLEKELYYFFRKNGR